LIEHAEMTAHDPNEVIDQRPLETIQGEMGVFRIIPNRPFLLKRLGSGRSGSASQIKETWPEMV
jgi:hypothetical protein